MPNIKTYDAPPLELRPTETGIEARAQAANRIGRFYNQVAGSTKEVGDQLARGVASDIKDVGDVAVQYAEHREISHGAATFAQLNDGLTQAWNDAAKNADPNDPMVAQRFRDGVLEPALEKYRDSFLTDGGQKFAEAHVQALRNHMFTKTSADMASLAKDAVSVNVHQIANSLSNTAMRDPSSVEHLLDSADGLVGGVVNSATNIKGADSARARIELTEKMKESIVKAGAIGAIQQSANPEAEAQKWGEKYPNYISGDELRLLSANARQQIRAQRTDEAYSRHLEDTAAKRASDARETEYLQKLYSDDPKDQAQVTTKGIVNDPKLERTAKERMINVVNREMKPETDSKISAQTSADIFRAMRDPNADYDEINRRIFDARAKDPGASGSLTKADFNDLQKQLIDIKTPQGQALANDRDEFFKRYAGTIDGYLGQLGIHSALGSQAMYLAEKDAISMERQLKAQGKDPRSLYDPRSPDFFGKPENITRYRVSMKQAQDAMAADANGTMNLSNMTITGISRENVSAVRTKADYDALKPGATYLAPDGSVRRKGGQ